MEMLVWNCGKALNNTIINYRNILLPRSCFYISYLVYGLKNSKQGYMATERAQTKNNLETVHHYNT